MIVRKHIFICYDAHDRNIASDMYEIFKTTLDDEVWIRFHNLHGGNIVASLLAEAVNEEKWVLLLISKNALENDAISSDIQQSTIRWLEGMNCRFIIVKVDNSPWPRHLKHILETTSYRIDISANEGNTTE